MNINGLNIETLTCDRSLDLNTYLASRMGGNHAIEHAKSELVRDLMNYISSEPLISFEKYENDFTRSVIMTAKLHIVTPEEIIRHGVGRLGR